MAKYYENYEYRYVAARGLERRNIHSRHWEPVTGAAFEEMTAEELRHCANVMEKANDDARAELDKMLAEAELRGAAKERERCAGIASAYGGGDSYAAKMIAAAIREGGA